MSTSTRPVVALPPTETSSTTASPRLPGDPPVRRSSRRRGRGSVQFQWNADRVILVVLGCLAAILGVWNLAGGPSYQEDEGTYTAQAFSVLDGHLAPYTYWYDHPPLGWIQLGAVAWLPHVLGVGDGTHIGATRYVIALYFVATALLLFLLARRLLIRRRFAVLAVVIFILSPLSLVLGRQVYLDNIGLPWLLLAFHLALSPRRALWHHVASGLFFAVAVLSKETLAIFGPALLLALVNQPRWSNRTFSLVGFLSVGGMVLGFYPLMALLRGELWAGPGHVSLQDALAYHLLSRTGSGSVLDAGSSRAELLGGWMYFDRYIIAAGLAAAAVCLLRRHTLWIPVAIASFALPVVLGQGYLPAMYIIGVLPFLALAIGAGLDLLWTGLESSLSRAGARVRALFRGLAAAALCGGLIMMSVPQWFEQDLALLSGRDNEDWRSTMAWVQDHVPRTDTVLTPYSMWQDLNASGWDDVWQMIVTEKADLDAEFLRAHPAGWQSIDWVIVGPIVRDNIANLGLTTAGEAVENSEPVQTFGEWSVHRVVAP